MMVITHDTAKYTLYIYRVEGKPHFHAEIEDKETEISTLLFDNIKEENLMATVQRLADQWFSDIL